MVGDYNSIICYIYRAGDRCGGRGIADVGTWASSLLKVTRTIADLLSSENILADKVSEVIQYRTLDRNFWA